MPQLGAGGIVLRLQGQLSLGSPQRDKRAQRDRRAKRVPNFWLRIAETYTLKSMSDSERRASAGGLSLSEAAHLQALEGNPLDAEQIEMFAMFEREGWPDQKRRDFIRRRALQRAGVVAAE